MVAATVQEASPGLGGTYIFLINGVQMSVFDITSDPINIAYSLKKIYPDSEIKIVSQPTKQLPDKQDFNILFIGVKDPLPISFDTTASTGGIDNIIDATVTIKRAYAADRPYFYGIPYDMMRTAEDKSTIDIGFKGMPSLCVDCTYSYQSTSPFSVVSAAFIVFPVFGMSLTLAYNPLLVTFDKSTDVVITLYG